MTSFNPKKDPIHILTPVGMLGRGFSEQIFWKAIKDYSIDAIIMDSGSTDSGPNRLATSAQSVPSADFEQDMSVVVRACHLHHIPVLIGSAGGDGENLFVDMLIDIVENLIKENGYRSMKVIGIYSEIQKEIVRQKAVNGLISPCGGGVPELTEHDIESATRIVAQMGHEPYVKAMEENPDFDIIIGGRAYDPAPYAAFCLYKGFNNMGTNYAMGKILECGAVCSIPKSREALAIVYDDYFDVVALDPKSQVTTVSVAAHFLYEKTRPDILRGPGGALLLSDTTYEQVGSNHVRVQGAKWEPEAEGEYTLKLEGARTNGYTTTFVGAFRDPILISQFDNFISSIEAAVKIKMGGVQYDLKIHRYGINGVMGALEIDTRPPKEVCVVVQARASTQEIAHQVASGCKFGFAHMPYPGQVATAGNFAWPFSPTEVDMGPLAEFCIYHIMHKCDPLEFCPIKARVLEGSASFVARTVILELEPTIQKFTQISTSATHKKYYLLPAPPQGNSYLGDIASVVRSKNSGPYELTFDVMFSDRSLYERVKTWGILSREIIARLYNIEEKDVVASLWWDQAMAFKATIVRPAVSGGFGETDMHGSQQHVPLLYVLCPVARESFV